MGRGITSLLFSIGFAGWLYYQLLRRSGGNTGTAIKASIGAGVAAFILVYTLMSFLPDNEV